MTKIMLVEDDKSLREIYGVRLLAEGYEIISAGDGEEALAMAVKEHPDLIISDVMMPKISGFDMLDILRATPETKEIRIIMMTALSSEDQRSRGESLGANRYLVKSQVGIEDVVRTVHEVLEDKQIQPTSNTQAYGAPAPSSVTNDPAPQPPTNQVPEPIASETEAINPSIVAQPTENIVEATIQPIPEPVVEPTQQINPEFSAPTQAASIAATPDPSLNTVEAINPTQLPEPTAPFSTPAPASLGAEFSSAAAQESTSQISPANDTQVAQEFNTNPVPPVQLPNQPQ